MRFIDENTIELEKELNALDIFVLEFIKILEKHTNYVIISGYVAILFGRTRATEDVDIFIEEIAKEKFTKLYQDLLQDYWCLNAEDIDEVYDYLEEGLAIRFAKKGQTIPNFEVKFAKKSLAKQALQDPLMINTTQGTIKISSLERQIAFKRYYLKSDKDLEDAQYLEKVFKEHISMDKVEHYRKLIENEKT